MLFAMMAMEGSSEPLFGLVDVDVVSDVVDGAVDAVSDVVDGAVDAVSDAVDDAVDAVSDVAGDVIDVAVDAVDTVIDGAVDVARDVHEAALAACKEPCTEAYDTCCNVNIRNRVACKWIVTDPCIGALNICNDACDEGILGIIESGLDAAEDL